MTLEKPSWLTEDYVKHALENGKQDDSVTITDLKIDKPIAKGDNYVCEIFRAKVEYQTSDGRPLKASLIIKAPIRSELYDLFAKKILQKEVRMYNEYMPKLQQLLGDTNTITPKSYHSDEEDVVVLEDLGPKGYAMANRQKQLDLDHCKIALETLAIFHAASMKIHQEQPEFVEDHGKEIFFHEDLESTNKDFSKFNFNVMAEESKSFPELSKYRDHFLKYSEEAWDIFVQLMKPNDNSFNVLNHGDFWVNNMLFKYDNGKPVGLKLIDLQVSRYASPAVDLTYFLYGSVQEDLRAEKTDELLNIYLKELNKNLEKFGLSQRLSEDELKHMIDLNEVFGLYVSISLFPIIIADPKEMTVEMKDVKKEDFENCGDNPFSKFYRNEKYINILVKRMNEFEKKGWL